MVVAFVDKESHTLAFMSLKFNTCNKQLNCNCPLSPLEVHYYNYHCSIWAYLSTNFILTSRM